MLDLDDPKTKHIFYAARIEDDIRLILVECMESDNFLSNEKRKIISDEKLNQLLKLNELEFHNSHKIKSSISSLKEIVLHEKDLQKIWTSFLSFADSPGDNFGTYAI